MHRYIARRALDFGWLYAMERCLDAGGAGFVEECQKWPNPWLPAARLGKLRKFV